MEPIPKPFLSSVKGKLDQDLRSDLEAEWLPPLKAAVRQLNMSEEEQQEFVLDVRKYADTIDPTTLKVIPRDQLLCHILQSIWRVHSRSPPVIPEDEVYTDSKYDAEGSDSNDEPDLDLNASSVLRAEMEAERELRNERKCKLLLDKVAPFFVDKAEDAEGFQCDVNFLSRNKNFSRKLWRYVVEHMEPEYSLPTLILKKHLYMKREEPRNLGPGCYDPHPIECKNICSKRKCTTRSSMQSCTPRFAREDVKTDSPDPGAYGNPWEKVCRYCPSGKVPLLQSGPCDIRGKTFKLVGSALGPGEYEVKSSIQELLDKRVSAKGPYDLFSQKDRFDIAHGYFKRPKQHLEPGMYGVHGGIKELLHSRHNRLKGKLSKLSKDQKCTGERITISNPMWPCADAKSLPGPGTYESRNPEYSHTCWGENFWAFNLSTNARPEDPADYDHAPTRYRPELADLKYCALGCGFKSNFNSTTGRLNYAKAKVLSERLRPKDIPPMEKKAAHNDDPCNLFK